MAASVGERRGVIAAINVTPMADVMIVLLIIFLVVTPLLTDDAQLQVPAARHGVAEERSPSLVVPCGAITPWPWARNPCALPRSWRYGCRPRWPRNPRDGGRCGSRPIAS